MAPFIENTGIPKISGFGTLKEDLPSIFHISNENLAKLLKETYDHDAPLTIEITNAVLCAKPAITSSFAVINADDFYGRTAFEALSKAMDNFDENSNATLITYSLNKTLSKNGTVTRGLCRVENEMLKGIYEAYKIKTGDDGVIYESLDDTVRALDSETPVSMNMWAFSKGTVSHMLDYLKDFLIKLSPDDNRSECVLPIMVDALMTSGILNVSALPTIEKWFGITYREDLEEARAKIEERHLEGEYPDTLF